jgi:hypothetical protein
VSVHRSKQLWRNFDELNEGSINSGCCFNETTPSNKINTTRIKNIGDVPTDVFLGSYVTRTFAFF